MRCRIAGPARRRRLAVAALGGAGGSFESAARQELGATRLPPSTPSCPVPPCSAPRPAPRSPLRPAMGNSESVPRRGAGKCGATSPLSPSLRDGPDRPLRSIPMLWGLTQKPTGPPCGIPWGGGCDSGISDTRGDTQGGGKQSVGAWTG